MSIKKAGKLALFIVFSFIGCFGDCCSADEGKLHLSVLEWPLGRGDENCPELNRDFRTCGELQRGNGKVIHEFYIDAKKGGSASDMRKIKLPVGVEYGCGNIENPVTNYEQRAIGAKVSVSVRANGFLGIDFFMSKIDSPSSGEKAFGASNLMPMIDTIRVSTRIPKCVGNRIVAGMRSKDATAFYVFIVSSQ